MAVQTGAVVVAAQAGPGLSVASGLELSSSSDQAVAEAQVCSSAHCLFETAASDQVDCSVPEPGSFAFDLADSEIPGYPGFEVNCLAEPASG